MPQKKSHIPDEKMYYTMVVFLIWCLVGLITFICLIVGGEKDLPGEYPLITGGYVFILIGLCIALVTFSNDASLKLPPSEATSQDKTPTSS